MLKSEHVFISGMPRIPSRRGSIRGEKTTIAIGSETKQRLLKLMKAYQSYDDFINILLDLYEKEKGRLAGGS